MTDCDPAFGLHQGQRSNAPHSTAGHMTAPSNDHFRSNQPLRKRSRPHMTATQNDFVLPKLRSKFVRQLSFFLPSLDSAICRPNFSQLLDHLLGGCSTKIDKHYFVRLICKHIRIKPFCHSKASGPPVIDPNSWRRRSSCANMHQGRGCRRHRRGRSFGIRYGSLVMTPVRCG